MWQLLKYEWGLPSEKHKIFFEFVKHIHFLISSSRLPQIECGKLPKYEWDIPSEKYEIFSEFLKHIRNFKLKIAPLRVHHYGSQSVIQGLGFLPFAVTTLAMWCAIHM